MTTLEALQELARAWRELLLEVYRSLGLLRLLDWLCRRRDAR